MGVEEARAYLDAFTSLQLWVLSLPDSDQDRPGVQQVENPLQKAQALIHGDGKPSLKEVMQELAKQQKATSGSAGSGPKDVYNMPPSAKSELLGVTFALLVHTYCELLEVGMESTAHCLRDAFQPIYDPFYAVEYRDLFRCTTTEDTIRLNSYNSQHMEALSGLKTILVRIAQLQLRREELQAQSTMDTSNASATTKQQIQQKIKEDDRNIQIFKHKYTEVSQRAAMSYSKMHDLPFLRRARAVRWQLFLSNATYQLLSSFLAQRDDSLVAMSTLLLIKCELHVEKRDPLPFTPAIVFDERDGKQRTDYSPLDINRVDVRWATPCVRPEDDNSRLGRDRLPYPKIELDKEYDSERQAARDKRKVEFNRALLVNGFRRLEALERKREYDVLPEAVQKRLKSGSVDLATALREPLTDPLEPSVLLTSLTASVAGPVLRPKSFLTAIAVKTTETASIWEEPGIGLCCAKICQPDGRRVAVGCDDASVRIYDVLQEAQGGGHEPSHVLLGHKNGFPVFSVDWNRDGRCLLSGGGDGAARLWDTAAVGPFGEVFGGGQGSNSAGESSSLSLSGTKDQKKKDDDQDTAVPGLKPEVKPYSSATTLAVYRGHTPTSPVWSVRFSPAGYYFATAGGDATARLWTTDRTIPVRLFAGHTSANVNCIEWHPNCNYLLTGADDKTCRLWDIQTGRTVRILNGCRAGIASVCISPGGRYALGSDHGGVVHMWDLGNGKKITEFHPPSVDTTLSCHNPMIHSMTISACGRSLATGGDACTVNIWDMQSAVKEQQPVVETPVRSFSTHRTLLMDLQFTKRNLLLAAGKLVTPIPLCSKG